MKVRDFTVKEIPFSTCKSFCAVWHYSKTCPVGFAYFGLYNEHQLIGVASYGAPAGRHQQSYYNCDIELRRLCCIDDTPKNTESFFIGKTLKAVKKKGYYAVLSLADPQHYHSGTIYRASNFKYQGTQDSGSSRKIVIIDGHRIHPRSCYAKYGTSGKYALQKLFPDSTIEILNTEPKHVYTYELQKKPDWW